MGIGQMGGSWEEDVSLIAFNIFFFNFWNMWRGSHYVLDVTCSLTVFRTNSFTMGVGSTWCCQEPSLKLWGPQFLLSSGCRLTFPLTSWKSIKPLQEAFSWAWGLTACHFSKSLQTPHFQSGHPGLSQSLPISCRVCLAACTLSSAAVQDVLASPHLPLGPLGLCGPSWLS